MTIRDDAKRIINAALEAAQPDAAVQRALADLPVCGGRLIVIAVGKAAWQMAAAAHSRLGDAIDSGVVITKYGHANGAIGKLRIVEAGHPVPDSNTYAATQAAIEAVEHLKENDLVLFLLSGGGSALFEKPLIDPAELEDVTRQLLACGAQITEINTLRKRFSAVKGGKFARLCAPAQVFSVVLSDVLGDPLDMIASGPTAPDTTTAAQARQIAEKYGLHMGAQAWALLDAEPTALLDNARSVITGSVRQLCVAAERTAKTLGYVPVVLSDCVQCEARDAGSFLASIARFHAARGQKMVFIAGGETVVHVRGDGKGGRNQELALAAAKGIAGLNNVLVFSLGSDGTDGPTDAAGGIVDGDTQARLQEMGVCIDDVLERNDAYHALQKVDGLIMTGPTGTNVNDLFVALIQA